MTLVITRINHLGVAMVADSAVTIADRNPGSVKVAPNAAKKLHRVRDLAAGVSCWGRGTISGRDTDDWIEEFLKTVDHGGSIAILAGRLAAELNQDLRGQFNGQGSIGFHVAGQELRDGTYAPDLWHVHDGPSDVNPNVDPRLVNANHDFIKFRTLRNGEYRPYLVFDYVLGQAYEHLRHADATAPSINTLEKLAMYGTFEIAFMTAIYAMSDTPPVIAGRIDCLTVNPDGDVRIGQRDNLQSIVWM